MTVRRLTLTTVAMAAVAVVLTALTPAVPVMTDALGNPQRTADRAGPEALVLAGAGLLAWLCWAWGALGLALTAASAVPGLFGRLAGTALHVVLPAGARRSAALLLGLGLGVTAPLAGTALSSFPAASAAVPHGHSANTVPDWPATSDPAEQAVPDWPTAVPDRPPAVQPAAHVVIRGDCLWSITERRLAEALGRTPTAAEVATEVDGWWRANVAVIGPDPDLLLPGQVLRPPSPP
jgi:hypothetical protein